MGRVMVAAEEGLASRKNHVKEAWGAVVGGEDIYAPPPLTAGATAL